LGNAVEEILDRAAHGRVFTVASTTSFLALTASALPLDDFLPAPGNRAADQAFHSVVCAAREGRSIRARFGRADGEEADQPAGGSKPSSA